MRRHAALVAVAVLLLATCAAPQARPPRNLIVMVPDGTSFSLVTLARWVKGEPLALDRILAGAVRTASANSVITDSAAAATAMATGEATDNGVLGLAPCDTGDAVVGPAEPPPCRQPLATLLEAARLSGLATGLVATSTIGHATPAGFAAHVEKRSDYDAIVEQLVHQDIDVVLGGGRRRLLPTTEGGTRTDGADLIAALRARDVTFVETAEQLAAVKRGPVWGALADTDMSPELDRKRLAPDQPDLETMTRKAIELLSADGRGFFLMVEGSQVDWGAHDNDAAYAITELLAFDDAVRAALEFAERDGNTLVLAFADHATGGASLGNERIAATWSRTSADEVAGPLRRMRATARAIARQLGPEPNEAALAAALHEWWGVDLDKGEAAEILSLHRSGTALAGAIGRTVSRRHTDIGWTTTDHVGIDVPLWSFGPDRPVGLIGNTEIAPAAAAFLGLDLADAESSLFLDAATALPDATIERPEGDDPWLVAAPCRVPANRDLVVCDGLDRPVAVDGVAFYVASTQRFYLSQAAVTVVQRVRDGLPVE